MSIPPEKPALVGRLIVIPGEKQQPYGVETVEKESAAIVGTLPRTAIVQAPS